MALMAVDMGGTNIRLAVFQSPDKMETHVKIPTRELGKPVQPESFVELIAEEVEKRGDIQAVGVALAAIVDHPSGIVRAAENIGWKDVPIRSLLQRRLPCPVHVEVDAYCGAIAEAKLGSGIGVDNLLYIVIGTGIGHGLIFDGEIWRGMHSTANVFGHLRVGLDGASCYCGGSGCLCQYSSGQGLARLGALYRGDGQALSGSEVVSSYDESMSWAVQAVNDAERHLATALSHVYNLLDIDRVVIGGGAVSPTYPSLQRLRKLAEPLIYILTLPIDIQLATFGQSGVLHGAAYLAREELRKT